MIDHARRLQIGDETVRRLASAVRSLQLYAATHPLVTRNLNAFADTLSQVEEMPTVVIGFVGDEIVFGETPLTRPSPSLVDLARRLRGRGIERLSFEQGATPDEFSRLATYLAGVRCPTGAGGGPEDAPPQLEHIRIGKLAIEKRTEAPMADMATIRRLYEDAVSAVENIWQGADKAGAIDTKAAHGVVQSLAGGVDRLLDFGVVAAVVALDPGPQIVVRQLFQHLGRFDCHRDGEQSVTLVAWTQDEARAHGRYFRRDGGRVLFRARNRRERSAD